LQKHRDHRRLHLAGQIVESLDLFENRIELRRRDKIRRPLRSYIRKNGTDDRDSPTDFLKELFVESIEFS
jgi:hypothetical protein